MGILKTENIENCDIDSVGFFSYYFPKNNNKHDIVSKNIIGLKENKSYSINGWKELICREYYNKGKRCDYIVRALSHNELQVSGGTPLDTIGNSLSTMLSAKYVPNLICKKKSIPRLHKLNKKQRWETLNGVYRLKNCKIKPNSRFIILDDVYTTGSTMQHIAYLLKRNLNASWIGGLCLGRTAREGSNKNNQDVSIDVFSEERGHYRNYLAQRKIKADELMDLAQPKIKANKVIDDSDLPIPTVNHGKFKSDKPKVNSDKTIKKPFLSISIFGRNIRFR